MLHEVDEQENRELRKFLKRVGVNSQRIIESYSGPKDDITISLNKLFSTFE